MAAHDPRLWETLQEFSQKSGYLDFTAHALRANKKLEISEALDFALTKAGKDSDFKLKTESIIEAVVDFFTPFARTVAFLDNILQTSERRTFS